MNLYKIFNIFKELIINTKKMLALAWKMDRRLTFLYYLTAFIGALIPVAAGITLRYLIDHLQIAQTALVPTISLMLVFVLALRYLVNLAGDLIYWIYNESYLNYLFRVTPTNSMVSR